MKSDKQVKTVEGSGPKTYSGVHTHIRNKYGNAAVCIWDATHRDHRFEWANVTGDYTTDIQDYLPMCAPCHRKFDVTDETREKSRKSATGRVSPKRVRVRQTREGLEVGVYVSVAEASSITGINRTSIHSNISGVYKTAGGFRWERA